MKSKIYLNKILQFKKYIPVVSIKLDGSDYI